ncbi:MAG: hypothetical protein E6713_02955 [Sporomusaceae bacterium]|nr:hypothetical protein [Sporomusaceae bacterium]
MNVRVNRYTVRHNGKDYGPGKVITGLSDEEGQKLVDESNGDIEEIVIPAEATTPAEGDPNSGGAELPPIDPSATVKPK